EDVLDTDPAPTLKTDDDGLEQRAQLHGVASPRQRGDQRQRRPRQRLGWNAERRADVADEVVRERWNVLAAVPERRQIDRDDRESAIEILAHSSVLDGAVEPGFDARHRSDVATDGRAG